MRKGKSILTLFSIFALILVIGCGAGRVDKELADAESARQEAIDAGAEGTQAFQEAEDLLAQARQLMEQGDYNGAREKLEEARFKYIEAKGEALSTQQMESMSEADREIQGEILGSQKPYLQNLQSTAGLNDVFFDYDSSSVRLDARATLDQNAAYLRSNAGNYKIIAVEGYCDTRGTEEYNLALGQRRAESVKNYLVGQGVSPSKIQALSKGETNQWSPGESEYSYQQNRRAHFVGAR